MRKDDEFGWGRFFFISLEYVGAVQHWGSKRKNPEKSGKKMEDLGIEPKTFSNYIRCE